MDFRVLGPLEVGGDGGTLDLGGVKQRSVLALLLLHANEVVSTDRLIDELWGGAQPATAAKSLQGHGSTPREQIGEGNFVTRAPGYVLRVDPSELDLAPFEQLVGRGEPGRSRHADGVRAQGLRPGGLASPETRTSLGWSLTGATR
jgi:DNA-binding SARP family transcriptional activator